MTTWADEYLRMVKDCERPESRLTDWECGFLDSIRRQPERQRPLSAKQTEALDKIWEHAAARG